MAQNLKLSEYLAQRGKKAKALTRIEADVFGIEYPLQARWPRRHGAMEITSAMIEQVEAHAAEAGMSADRQVRRSAKRAVAALPTQAPGHSPEPVTNDVRALPEEATSRPATPALSNGKAQPNLQPDCDVNHRRQAEAMRPSQFPGFAVRPALRHRAR